MPLHALREPAANDAQDAVACSFPRRVLRCEEGFEFRQLDADTVMLMQQGQPGPVLKCGCNMQGCGLQLDPHDRRIVLALENVCHGNWGWSVRIPGIAQAAMLLATESTASAR